MKTHSTALWLAALLCSSLSTSAEIRNSINGDNTSLIPNQFRNRPNDYNQLIDVQDTTPGNAGTRYHGYSQDNTNANRIQIAGWGASNTREDRCLLYSTRGTSADDGKVDRSENHFHNGTKPLQQFGRTAFVAFSFKIEPDTEAVQSWRLIHQWHQGTAPGAFVPIFGIYMKKGTSDVLEFRRHYRREADQSTRGGVVLTEKITKGYWYDVMIEMRGGITADQSGQYGGRLKIWLSRTGQPWGPEKYREVNAPIGYDDKWASFDGAFDSHRTGIYQGHPNGSFRMRVDNMRVGENFDWVRAIKFTQQSDAFPAVGDVITLRGNNSRFLSSENGRSDIAFNRTRAQGWERFTVEDAGSGKIALRGNNGRYVRHINNGASLRCDWTSKSGGAAFEIRRLANKQIHLKASNGRYVSSENGGRITANRTRPLGWETFTAN